MKRFIPYIIICLLGGIIGWLLKPVNCSDANEIVKIEKIIQYQDTGSHRIEIRPEPYKVIVIQTDTFESPIDTMEVVKEII